MALCRLLAKEGVALLITGRDQDRLASLSAELNSQVAVEWFAADLAIKADRRRLVDIIHSRVPDLVVNNAGFGLYGEVLTYETGSFDPMIDVNIKGVLDLTVEAARALVSAKKPGVILNVSSAADFLVFPGLAVYAATKAFVTQVSLSLDIELKGRGVRVLAACPGVVKTEFRTRAAGEERTPEGRTAMDVDYAAWRIWKQIVKRQRLCRFDWKTRFGAFIGRNLLPKALVGKVLFRVTEGYHPARKLIK
jgi:short-subunit dehydrogenase